MSGNSAVVADPSLFERTSLVRTEATASAQSPKLGPSHFRHGPVKLLPAAADTSRVLSEGLGG